MIQIIMPSTEIDFRSSDPQQPTSNQLDQGQDYIRNDTSGHEDERPGLTSRSSRSSQETLHSLVPPILSPSEPFHHSHRYSSCNKLNHRFKEDVPDIFETLQKSNAPLELEAALFHTPHKRRSDEEQSVSLNSDCVKAASLLVIITAASIVLVFLVCRTLPELKMPTSLQSIRNDLVELRSISNRSYVDSLHLALVLGLLLVFKQTFSIPGSILMNVLMGSIYGVKLSTFLSCCFTSVGSSLAYYLARSMKPLVKKSMPNVIEFLERRLDRFRRSPSHQEICLVEGSDLADSCEASHLQGHSDHEDHHIFDSIELWNFLLMTRLIPIAPSSALNIAFGVLEIPIGLFFWSVMLGSIPYNFVTCQVGQIVSEGIQLERLDQLWTFSIIMKLILISVISLVPILFKNQLRFSLEKLNRLFQSQTKTTK